MAAMLIKRLLVLPFVLFGVTFVLFVVSQIIPSDPVRLVAGDSVTPETRAAIERELGLDQPLPTQYFIYIERLVQGDLGESLRYATPVKELLFAAFPATVILVGVSAIIAVVMAFPLGFLAAKFKDSWIDLFARGVAIVGIATPAFYLGIVMILVFGFYLSLFPISGRGDPPDLWHLILPAFVLGFRDAGSAVRIFRASLLDSFSEDYIRAARARGIGERSIVTKLAARNALIPTVTDMGLNFANLAGQVILVETVFAYPGIGRLLYIGIRWNDFPLVAGAVMLLLVYAVVINLVVDLLYRAIDPRMRTA
jgi:peptide/nickel transport system permease protein